MVAPRRCRKGLWVSCPGISTGNLRITFTSRAAIEWGMCHLSGTEHTPEGTQRSGAAPRHAYDPPGSSGGLSAVALASAVKAKAGPSPFSIIALSAVSALSAPLR